MLTSQIDEDLKSALKAKDSLKLETLRMLKAAIHNFLIEKRKDTAADAEVVTLIQKQVKQRDDSIEGFKKGGRQELADKEAQEKAILESYLPKQLSDPELESLVKAAIQLTGAQSKADMGKVMKEAASKAAGRADGKRINQFVTKLLP